MDEEFVICAYCKAGDSWNSANEIGVKPTCDDSTRRVCKTWSNSVTKANEIVKRAKGLADVINKANSMINMTEKKKRQRYIYF